MIYTVTFNPALDYVVTLDELNVGGLNRNKAEQILAGGKGINVSTVLKNLGIDNTALGFIAGFTGKKIESMLNENGYKTDFIYIEEGMSRINIKVKSGIETEINGIGPDISDTYIKKLYNKLDSLQKGDVLVLAGSVPSSVNDSIYRAIMKHLEEKDISKDIRIVVDASGELLRKTIDYTPFLVKPNIHELAGFFEVPDIKTREDAVFYAKKLKKMGPLNVLVSMGANGAILIDEFECVHVCDAPDGEVINTVGAGDSMVAAFIAGFTESIYKCDYARLLKLCVAAGSASAFSKNLATKEEVLRIYDKM